MRCAACKPDYCACADFYAGRMAYWKGEIMPEADECPCTQCQTDTAPAAVEPVAYRYVYLDYAGRRVSYYGASPERLGGKKPIEAHPLYAFPPALPTSELVVAATKLVEVLERDQHYFGAEYEALRTALAKAQP